MTPTLPAAEAHLIEGTSLWQDAWGRFRRNRAALAGAATVLVIVFVSLIGPWLVYLYNGFEYDTLGLDNRLANPSLKHVLGSDTLARGLAPHRAAGRRSRASAGRHRCRSAGERNLRAGPRAAA